MKRKCNFFKILFCLFKNEFFLVSHFRIKNVSNQKSKTSQF